MPGTVCRWPALLVTTCSRRPGAAGTRRRRIKPFLHHVVQDAAAAAADDQAEGAEASAEGAYRAQVQAILDACEHLRDRLLFALMLDTGVRIGEALGLRHEDIGSPSGRSRSCPRDNDNRARAKAGRRGRSRPAPS